MKNDIPTLEQLSMNAWPSLQTMFYDGWILRFANGVTRRSNSVNSIYKSTRDVEEKITFCEKIYTENNLPTIFKLTSAACPANLDKILSQRNYLRQAETSVQTFDLTNARFEENRSIILNENLEENWVRYFVSLNKFNTDKIQIYHAILQNIIPETIYASYRIGNEIKGCGLGVKQGKHIGLFDIVVDEEHRGVGLGYYIATSLMKWGKSKGASIGYLQVMTDNEIALHLYEKLGFTEQYKYWYRVK